MARTQIAVVLSLVMVAVPSALWAEGGLVAHYPLDMKAGSADWEGVDTRTGPTAFDLSGNKNHGRIHGAKYVRVESGHMLAFDGNNDVVDCGNPPALDIRGPITVSAWVHPDEVPAGEVAICGKDYNAYYLTYYKVGECYWYVGDGANNVRAAISPDRWTHIVGTFDGKDLTLFLNGKPVRTRPSRHTSVPQGGRFLIGGRPPHPDFQDPNQRMQGYFKGMIGDVRVYDRALHDEEIRVLYGTALEQRFGFRPVECKRITTGPTIEKSGIRVRGGRDGATQIEFHGGFCILESTLSFPGDRIGRNALGKRTQLAERDWQPQVKKLSSDTLRITAQGAFYALRRDIRLRNSRVEVSDTIANRGTEPVGVLIHHQVATPKPLRNTRLGYGPEDPIVFGGQPDCDLGIVAEDRVSRLQAGLFCGANRAGFYMKNFALDVGKSATFRWAVYMMEPTGDAMDFINVVRRHWKSNHTLLGPCSFFHVAGSPLLNDPTALKKYLKRRRLGIAMLSSPWMDYDPGSLGHVLPREEYKTLMQRAMKTIKAADPNIKCVGCIEPPIVTIYPEKIKGGERLPVAKAGGSYMRLTPQQIRIIMDSDLPWKDCAKRNRDGSMELELYMRGGRPQTALVVYPEPGNYQAKFLMEQVRFLVEEVGMDGIYTDGISFAWMRSYEKSDGTTVDIDPTTGRITSKYTNCGLVSTPVRHEFYDYITSRRLVWVSNSYATTALENALPVMRFRETWSDFDVTTMSRTGKPVFNPALAGGQLNTPIGLGVHHRTLKHPTAQHLMRGIILYLRHGMVYYHYIYPDLLESGPGSGEYGPINHMFPITPVRIFEGGIIGKERTITCVTGTYEWKHTARPTVLVFGPDGREKKGNFTLKKSPDGWRIDLRLNDWKDIAVIAGAGKEM